MMPDDPIILPRPVAVVGKQQQVLLVTKILSWITATMLTLALLLSIVSITAERNTLRDRLSEKTEELVCRDQADDTVSKLTAERDNTLSAALIAAANGDKDTLTATLEILRSQTAQIDHAIQTQIVALASCSAR